MSAAMPATGPVRGSEPAAGTALGFRSKADLVHEALRDEILAGSPRPGERLVVDQVAARLGVSKVPVREAVTRLIGEGWLVQQAHVGPVVPTFTGHDVLETALLRASVEDVALGEAVPRHTEVTLAHLDRLLAAMVGEVAQFPAFNCEFHRAVLAPAPFAQVLRIAETLQQQARRYNTVLRVRRYREIAHAEHEAIVAALRAGDAEEVRRLNRAHIVDAAERLAAQLDPQ